MKPSAGDVVRAILLAGVLLISARAAASDGANAGEAVVPPGQGDLIAELLGRGMVLPSGCRFTSGKVDGPIVSATFACASGAVDLELRHPSRAPAAIARTAQFAIVLQRGAPPAGFVESLVSRIGSREDAFHWAWAPTQSALPQRSSVQAVLRVVVIVLPIAAALAGCMAVSTALQRRRRLRAAVRRRGTFRCNAVAALRVAGLLAVGLIVLRGAVARADPLGINLAISLGVLCLAGFLWLVLSGWFGYGSAGRGDWVGLVAFGVALIVREGLTVHSVQEIEIQFARGPVGRHSVVYPLLQLFFAPLVRDAQAFTMHMNGVLGALACLSLYLFVRQRLESRTAGVLAALFLATHPLVARFSPTDGPYSLLLVTWFSGLALLSARALDAGAMFGGFVLLGIAATARIEGFVLLLASGLMLDPRVVIRGVRRYPMVAVCSLLVVAALGAVQMYFLLVPYIRVPPVPGLNNLVDDVVWPVTRYGRLFTVLIVLGALSGIVTRRWLGLSAFVAMLIVVAPVVHSTHSTAMHRLVPACALQALVAAIGAYTLTVWIPSTSRWRWLAAIPGVAAVGVVAGQHRGDLTRPYVFTEEYELVRRHLAPAGASAPDCTLMAFPPGFDYDIHDFAQVVPDMQVLDCRQADCRAASSTAGCFYYVRSAACYFHPDGVPPACSVAGTTEQADRFVCMNEPSASFERSVELEPIEVRTIALRDTFADFVQNYPERAEIGLFRVGPKHPG